MSYTWIYRKSLNKSSKCDWTSWREKGDWLEIWARSQAADSSGAPITWTRTNGTWSTVRLSPMIRHWYSRPMRKGGHLLDDQQRTRKKLLNIVFFLSIILSWYCLPNVPRLLFLPWNDDFSRQSRLFLLLPRYILFSYSWFSIHTIPLSIKDYLIFMYTVYCVQI